MEKFKRILVCWKKIYEAEKELMEIEKGVKPEENEWYKGAESAVQSILSCLMRLECNENKIKNELKNINKIEE